MNECDKGAVVTAILMALIWGFIMGCISVCLMYEYLLGV